MKSFLIFLSGGAAMMATFIILGATHPAVVESISYTGSEPTTVCVTESESGERFVEVQMESLDGDTRTGHESRIIIAPDKDADGFVEFKLSGHVVEAGAATSCSLSNAAFTSATNTILNQADSVITNCLN